MIEKIKFPFFFFFFFGRTRLDLENSYYEGNKNVVGR